MTGSELAVHAASALGAADYQGAAKRRVIHVQTRPERPVLMHTTLRFEWSKDPEDDDASDLVTLNPGEKIGEAIDGVSSVLKWRLSEVREVRQADGTISTLIASAVVAHRVGIEETGG